MRNIVVLKLQDESRVWRLQRWKRKTIKRKKKWEEKKTTPLYPKCVTRRPLNWHRKQKECNVRYLHSHHSHTHTHTKNNGTNWDIYMLLPDLCHSPHSSLPPRDGPLSPHVVEKLQIQQIYPRHFQLTSGYVTGGWVSQSL